jgi:hypothetical protein
VAADGEKPMAIDTEIDLIATAHNLLKLRASLTPS